MASIRKSQSDRSAETSGKILRAAQKLFALRGFDGVTMRAIASEAGVNLASIVYYFENKEGLYLAVFRQYAEPLMEERMKMLKEADLHPSLRTYARAFIEPAFRLLLDKNLGGPDHARLLWRLPQEPEYLGRKIYDEILCSAYPGDDVEGSPILPMGRRTFHILAHTHHEFHFPCHAGEIRHTAGTS